MYFSFNGREVGSYVGLKVLKEQLDPTSPLSSFNINSSDDAHSPRGSIVGSDNSTGTTKRLRPTRSNRSVSSRRSQPNQPTDLPEFVLPKSYYSDFLTDTNFFFSTLPKLPDDIAEYPTTTAAPFNQSFVLKVRNYMNYRLILFYFLFRQVNWEK